MEDNKIRDLAKKILHAKTFQELHDIIMEYANDELEFVEFPDSLDKFIPTGGKQDHEKNDHGTGTWPDKFSGDGLPPRKFPGSQKDIFGDSPQDSIKKLKDMFTY